MNKKGSYLIELIFMISIITSILLLIPFSKQSSCTVKVNYFIKTLESDILYGLTYSTTHFTTIKIYIIPNLNTYVFNDGNMTVVIRRNYDKAFIISSSTIEISHGQVISPVSFQLSCENHTYLISISEKSGRVYVT